MDKDDSSKPNIKLLVTDDIQRIVILKASIWERPNLFSTQEYYRILKQNLSYCYILNTELIGICLVDSDNRNYPGVVISILCIKKEHQGKGLGKSLLNHCINNCFKFNYYTFFLQVAINNKKAYNLYKKLGFNEIQILKNYYKNERNPDDRDAYLMKLEKKANHNLFKNPLLMNKGNYNFNYNYNNTGNRKFNFNY